MLSLLYKILSQNSARVNNPLAGRPGLEGEHSARGREGLEIMGCTFYTVSKVSHFIAPSLRYHRKITAAKENA
jgi:hypothetical protein